MFFEIIAAFFVMLLLAFVLFFTGPAILEGIVALGEMVEAKANEWRRIFDALRGKGGKS